MTKAELQKALLDNTVKYLRLAFAIDRLPNSVTRNELIHKYNIVETLLVKLHTAFEPFGITECYFGFTNKCPGTPCTDCTFWEELNGS